MDVRIKLHRKWDITVAKVLQYSVEYCTKMTKAKTQSPSFILAVSLPVSEARADIHKPSNKGLTTHYLNDTMRFNVSSNGPALVRI
jgi:hypothetical protein